jgi:hypothetical protein
LIPSETRGLARHRRMGKSASKKERLRLEPIACGKLARATGDL